MDVGELEALTAWLGVQLAEREAAIRSGDHADRETSLAMITAVRRVLALVNDVAPVSSADSADGYDRALEDVVRLLAVPYAHHDGYRQAWRPQPR